MFCSKCGAELKEDAGYCYKCGTATHPAYTVGAGNTGLDILTRQRDVQDVWLRRAIAFVIDVLIIGVAALIIGLAFAIPFLLFPGGAFASFWGVWVGGLVPFLSVAYFILAEAGWQRTIGKEVMGLKTVRLDGKPVDLWSSFLRNISKIYWLLLLLDIVVGLAMQGSAHQKFSDRYAGTTVESVRTTAQVLR